jgi:hypothetical protein
MLRAEEPQDAWRDRLLQFARDLHPQAYAEMGVGYDFRGAFWKMFVEHVSCLEAQAPNASSHTLPR